jgi:hypothetical protein
MFALLAIGDIGVNWSLLAASAVVTAFPVMIKQATNLAL